MSAGTKSLGQAAYEAACTVSPVPPIPWEDANHEKWNAAADAVAAACVPAKDMSEITGMPMHDTVFNAVHRVYFRAGLLACREFVARQLEPQSQALSALVRLTWWPGLGADPGQPRRNDFFELADELKDGTYVHKSVEVSVEALPIALQFIETVDREAAATATGASAP